MWIEVRANVGAMGVENYKPVMVNFDDVKKVSQHDEGAKLTFTEGDTLAVSESYEKLKAILTDSLSSSYRAPDPKAA